MYFQMLSRYQNHNNPIGSHICGRNIVEFHVKGIGKTEIRAQERASSSLIYMATSQNITKFGLSLS